MAVEGTALGYLDSKQGVVWQRGQWGQSQGKRVATRTLACALNS